MSLVIAGESKMDVWKKPGQYTLEIPVTWGANELEDSTEFVPENEDAAIHVSVFKKATRSSPRENDAVALVENFAQKNSLHLNGGLNVACHENSCNCFGHFSSSGEDLGQPHVWVVKGTVGWHKGILGTLCLDESEGSSYTEGLAILNSLKLEEI